MVIREESQPEFAKGFSIDNIEAANLRTRGLNHWDRFKFMHQEENIVTSKEGDDKEVSRRNIDETDNMSGSRGSALISEKTRHAKRGGRQWGLKEESLVEFLWCFTTRG